MSKHNQQIDLDDYVENADGSYTLKTQQHRSHRKPVKTKWRNTKIWLSDGAPVQYQRVGKGTRKRIDRPGDCVVDSIKERRWYLYFQRLLQEEQIRNFKWQVAFELIPTVKHNGETLRKKRYTADFLFIANTTVVLDKYAVILPGITAIVEIKSPATSKDQIYRLRRHLFISKHIIEYPLRTFVEII